MYKKLAEEGKSENCECLKKDFVQHLVSREPKEMYFLVKRLTTGPKRIKGKYYKHTKRRSKF